MHGCAHKHSIKVIQCCHPKSHPRPGWWVDKHFLDYENSAPLPVENTCKALQLRGMALSSVDQVTSSPFGHLHDQLIYVAPELTGPQKELISVPLQLLHGEMKM